MRYDGKNVLVVGLGASGRSAVRFFAQRGATVSVTDRGSAEKLAAVLEPLQSMIVHSYLGEHPLEAFLAQDIIVPSPGVPWNMPELVAARDQGVRVAGELDFAAEELSGKVIGVTGSNGKTTTVSLIGHILETAGIKTVVAGNIGTPLLDIAEESADDQWSVLELSSFQLEAMETFRCNIVAILNITPDHLDRHGDFDSYTAAKARILATQTAVDTAVLNREDPVVAGLAGSVQGKLVWFQSGERSEDGASTDGQTIWFEGRWVGSASLPIPGAHNLQNALAAAAVCAIAGAPDIAIAAGLASFKAVEHRLERVASIGGVDYFNDSKATNVDATRKAIESFESGVWLILGGRDKQGDFTSLADALEGRVRRLLLIGEAAAEIERQLAGQPLTHCGDLASAVRLAALEALPGETVLLSPACASFDQFDSYGHRGREFKRLVDELAKVRRRAVPRQLHYDRVLCLTILGLTCFGLLMVFSVTAADGDPNPIFIIKQAIAAAIGLTGMRFLIFRDYHDWRNQKIVFGVVGAAIVLLVLAFAFGGGANTGRWLNLGLFSFQPSELAKLAVILFLAYYLETHGEAIDSIRSLAGAAIVLAAFCALILIGRDLGTAVAIAIVAATMLWAAGLKMRWFLGGIVLAIALGYVATVIEPYRMQRIATFLHPEEDPLGAGFQPMQSKIAVGSGGITGQGLMFGRQKMRFLPEAHTDFIFGVIGEETGLIGCSIIVVAFGVVLWRGLWVAMRAPDSFGRYLAVGVTAMIVCQAMINMGVALSMLPTKGMPLPFVSYGGSSLMMSLIAAGLLLNVSQHAD